MSNIGNVTFGETIYLYEETDASSVAIGIDSDDQVFKLSTSLSVAGDTLPSTNPNFMIDTAVNGDITLSPNGSGKTDILNGNLNLPNTSSLTNGMVTMGSSPFAHIGVGGTAKVSTYLGINSGIAVTTASNNTGLGQATLVSVTSGSYNTAVGTGAGGSLTNESSNILIKNLGTVGESHAIRIGTPGSGNGQQDKCFIAGIDGVNVGSVAKVVTENSNQLGTATITAGTGITVTPGANTITIASSATSFTWSVITAAGPLTMVPNNGYINNTAFINTFVYPVTAAVGDIFRVTQMNSGGSWSVGQQAGQSTIMGSATTTVGGGGSLDSQVTTQGACVEIVCIVANTQFMVISSMGNINVI